MAYFEQTSINDIQNNKQVQLTANREIRVAECERVAGRSFWGNTLDTNYFISTTSNGATAVVSNGELVMTTSNLNASSSTALTSKIAGYTSGIQNYLKTSFRLINSVTNNIRRIGVFDNNDGFFFEYTDGVFSIGVRKGTTNTKINNGSFNGNYGAIYTLNENYHTCEIMYGQLSCEFYIDNILLHKISATTSPLVANLSLPATIENTNTGITSNTALISCILMTIYKLSSTKASTKSYNIESNGTYTLKIGTGIVRAIIITDNVGTITIYDNIAASGTKLVPTIDSSQVIGRIDFGIDFQIGLTIITTNGARVAIIYE